MNLRKKLGRIIPYKAIVTGRKLIHAGPHKCLVCGGRVRTFLDAGYGFPVLEELQVVGGLRRRADCCPVCHSGARERLVWFWLTNAGRQFRLPPDTSVAHFAPEKGLALRLQDAAENYDAYDFEPARYRHLQSVKPANLAKLTIADGQYDLVICNHVIEHVPDALTALREIERILTADGVAILQVPISLKLAHTRELGTDSEPQMRIDQLGQDDHLRLFSASDYETTLQAAGFEVEVFNAFEMNAKLATQWQLDPFEKLYLCRKAR